LSRGSWPASAREGAPQFCHVVRSDQSLRPTAVKKAQAWQTMSNMNAMVQCYNAAGCHDAASKSDIAKLTDEQRGMLPAFSTRPAA
jgi:hypothetical protein